MFRFCDQCGEGYHAKRKRATSFCSGRCRVAYHRASVSNDKSATASNDNPKPAPISNTAAELISAMAKKPARTKGE